jgi:hypothetical protein
MDLLQGREGRQEEADGRHKAAVSRHHEEKLPKIVEAKRLLLKY